MIEQCCRCIHAKSVDLPHVECEKCGNIEIDMKTDWSKNVCNFYDDAGVPYYIDCRTCNHSANIRVVNNIAVVFCMEKEEPDHISGGGCYLWELADCCKSASNIYEPKKPRKREY
jgi:hypothetical protein